MDKKKKGPKIKFNSPVILCFVFLCFLETLAGILTNNQITVKYFMSHRSSLTSIFTYFRMFSHVIGHQGMSHFCNNALYLLLLGPMLEEKYKSKQIILVIVFTAAASAIVNAIFFPNVWICGASGVVFAFIIMSSLTGYKNGEIPLTFLLIAVIYIGQQVVQGLTIVDDVSNVSHIIGGIVGMILGHVFNKKKKKDDGFIPVNFKP